MIPVIPQLAICKQLACPNEDRKLRNRLLRVISFGTVQISPENATWKFVMEWELFVRGLTDNRMAAAKSVRTPEV